MSRQTLEAEGHEKLVTNRFGVVTQYIFCCNKNKTATPKFCRDIIKVCCDRIQERAQRTGRNRILLETTEANEKY